MQRSAAGGSETQQIIHDVAYDYFGRRVAVCSSDQWIRIYDDSVKTAEWKAHGGSIWRLTWAHPEFGQVLASCSFDRKICIWEERGDTEESTLASNAAWRLARELQDSRDSVNHVTFAPKRWGLLLASCSADRKVRLHEAPDVMDLAGWGLTAEFEADAGKGRAAVAPQCVAWNPSPTEPLMLVIGMSDGSAILWKQQENSDGTVNWVRVLAFDSAPAVSKPPRGVTYEPLARHVASAALGGAAAGCPDRLGRGASGVGCSTHSGGAPRPPSPSGWLHCVGGCTVWLHCVPKQSACAKVAPSRADEHPGSRTSSASTT
jgi:nucleoporin SEH1